MRVFQIAILCILIGLISCSKPSGEGGKGSISGIVSYNRYDHNDKLINTEIAKEEKVYIVYGENTFFDDDVDSYTDGSYHFEYLRKGHYQIIAFEDCNTCDSEKQEVVYEISLDKNNSEASNTNLTIRKDVAVDDGTGVISGRVWTQQYSGLTPIGNPYIDELQRVYLVYDTDSAHFDRVDTDANGYYSFSNLIQGNYTLFAYSGCDGCGVNLVPKEVTGSIASKGGELVLDITIEQH